MVTFNIPIQGSREEEVFRFSVVPRSVLFAGSRYRQVQQELCAELIRELHQEGFSFMVGCAHGVDRSFRQALAQNHYKEQALVACAFARRTHYPYSYGLDAFVVVPPGIPPRAALRRRTLWMVKRCSMVVLFPENPNDHTWGKGSNLVFHSSMYHLKPVFVVSSAPPKSSIHYRIFKTNLFGVVEGYWTVPHPFGDGGMCDDEY